MKSASRIPRLGLLSVVLGLSVSLAATAQGPKRPPRPERSPRLLDELRPRALAAEATSSAATIYVETFGTDTPRCGIQRLPCRTINYGLYRAEQMQPDPFILPTDGSLVTVQVGPGTYNELVVITANFVQVVGAGPGNTIITAGRQPDYSGIAVLVHGRNVYLDGLTFSDSDRGVWVGQGALAHITNSLFVDNEIGLVVGTAYAFVQSCTFTNNAYGAEAASSSRLHLWDVNMTGPGTEVDSVGVTSDRGSSVMLQSTDPNTRITIANFMEGIEVWGNAMIQVRRVQITGNACGMWIDGDSYVSLGQATVSDNSTVGIYLSGFSHASLANTTFSDNGDDDIIAEAGSDYEGYPPPSP